MSALTVTKNDRLGAQVVQLPVSRRRRRPPLPVFALLGWIAAALGVYSLDLLSRGALAGFSPIAIVVAKILVIVSIGAAFARVVRGSDPDLVLAAGVGWLGLSIAADFAAGVRSVDVAYRLLGDPTIASQNLRTLTILVWLAAPVLFARRSSGDTRKESFAR